MTEKPRARKRAWNTKVPYYEWESELPRKKLKVALSESLEQLYNHLGIADKLHDYMAIQIWKNVVGNEIGEVTAPKSITDGVLNVSVTKPTWRHELIYLKSEIIFKLNSALGRSVVRDIQFS